MSSLFHILKVFLVLLLAGVCMPGCRTGRKSSLSSDSSLVAVSNQSDKAVAVPLAPEIAKDPRRGDRIPESHPKDTVCIRPGLVINVNVFVGGKKEIEVSGHRVTDSGSIAIPLLGTIEVNNLTIEEITKNLTASYGEYFVNPQVIVEFVRDDSREGLSPWGSVTVLGRVKLPGKISIPATRDLTLSAAIQQAGGFDTSPKQSAIRITSRLGNGELESREVDFRAVGAQGHVEDDIKLEPGDVVFVPELVF